MESEKWQKDEKKANVQLTRYRQQQQYLGVCLWSVVQSSLSVAALRTLHHRPITMEHCGWL